MLENKGVLNLIALSMLGSMMEGNIKELKKKEKILGKYTGQDWIDDLLDIAPSRNNVPKNKPQKTLMQIKLEEALSKKKT